jgi:antitoxin VapB
MTKTAKLFRNGRSQAVRLPAEFRFEGKEVTIRRDPSTGDVILSRRVKPHETFRDFLDLADRLRSRAPDEFEGFMDDRPYDLPPERDPFQ